MKFVKMQSLGNDYIYIYAEKPLTNASALSKIMSPRRFSIGADGLIVISKSCVADAKMQIFNSDGSEAKMCGNGVRCVAKYLYENGIVNKKNITVETLSGVKNVKLSLSKNGIKSISVNMGIITEDSYSVGLKTVKPILNKDMILCGESFRMTCLSVGNSHAVLFTENVDNFPLEKIYKSIENCGFFKNGFNMEIVTAINKNTIKMRVRERGSGETYACGTGACAAVSALTKAGFLKEKTMVKVLLKGGELKVKIINNTAFLYCESDKTVYKGEINI